MKIIDVGMTNLLLGGDYTVPIFVGSNKTAIDVVLDTGSSVLAVDSSAYKPDSDKSAQFTELAQAVGYGSGWWIGSVIRTEIAMGHDENGVEVSDASISVILEESKDMFGLARGILGLAYKTMDTAYNINEPSWPAFDPRKVDIANVRHTSIAPYFTRLEEAGAVPNRFAIYAKRSKINFEGDPESNFLNHGRFILGGGPEKQEYYTGDFFDVSVVHDVLYNVNLKSVSLSGGHSVAVGGQGPDGSNAIVDSGTNILMLPANVIQGLHGAFYMLGAKYSNAISAAQKNGNMIDASALNLEEWPEIRLTLQGPAGDVDLYLSPSTYWQLNASESGQASYRIMKGGGSSILGLPLLNNYYTVFDRSGNDGKGIIRFAEIR